MLACSDSYFIEFKPGTSEPLEPKLAPSLTAGSMRRLDNPERSVVLVGHAAASEVASELQRQQLARQRAERARKLLTASGIAPERIQLEVGTAPQGTGGARDAPGRVEIRSSPPGPLQNDYDPDSREYKNFCPLGPAGT